MSNDSSVNRLYNFLRSTKYQERYKDIFKNGYILNYDPLENTLFFETDYISLKVTNTSWDYDYNFENQSKDKVLVSRFTMDISAVFSGFEPWDDGIYE